jgi:hypothetical protein
VPTEDDKVAVKVTEVVKYTGLADEPSATAGAALFTVMVVDPLALL